MDLTQQQQRRLTRGASMGERPVQTKLRLATALAEVLERGGEPSVAAVTTRAGIGRSTFYTHFTSLDELLEFSISELFAHLAPGDQARRSARVLPLTEITRIGLTELVAGVLGNRLFAIYASKSGGVEVLRAHLVTIMVESLRGTILAERPRASESFVALTAEYIASGVISILVTALAQPDRYTQQELIEVLLELLPSWLSAVRAE